ncbi:hypothetical protein [Stutzerimonas kunmingensis]|uniref:hypothetical protein n=1 Tax=Stutzerimonas kunmingensis TaxID=1211807 RepID=UPI00241FC685|nr:hypothetical protein [Stutzerimonas kunmingensis]
MMITFPTLASQHQRRYGSPQVAAKSATQGVRTLLENLAHMRPHTIAGAFFVPAMSLYGGPCWAGFGLAGFQVSRFLTPARSATLTREKVGGSSSIKLGAPPMKTTRNPSTHAAAWKARAFAALRSDSSLSVRLRRYNEAMVRARSLETVGGVQ